MRYKLVDSLRGRYSVGVLCRTLEVSRSGYYGWRKRKESPRCLANRRLLVAIRAIHRESQRRYGSPRVHLDLLDRGYRCGKHRVARLMQENRIRAKHKRRFRVTTDSSHFQPIAPDRLQRRFNPERRNQVWASDITYIPTRAGWLYLAVTLDLFQRKIVGWAMDRTLSRHLVMRALSMAVSRERPGSGLIHHSDRGSQYASSEFQTLLNNHGLVPSMSRKGNCLDNAVVESFFHTLKVELVQGRNYATRKEARSEIFEYIEGFYNTKRRHSTLGYLSPVQFEQKTGTT